MQRFLQSVQPLKTPELPTSTFDLEGTPRCSAQTSSEPFFYFLVLFFKLLLFYLKKTVMGGSVAGRMVSPYCVPGPAGGD